MDAPDIPDISRNTRLGIPADRLAGLRVGVTAGRRGEELVEALTRLGADVVWGPTVEVVPAPPVTLARQTAAVLAARPPWVMVTTAEGLNRWVGNAREARDDLLDLLANAKVAARGAKATAACREHGVGSVLTSPTERGVDLARLVIDLAEVGDLVAVVADGSGSLGVLAELEGAGLAVQVVAPYRWTVPAASGPVSGECVPAGDLLRALCAGEIDAMAFTSPPGVEGLFAVATALGMETALYDTLSGAGPRRVLVAAIGPVTAEALEDRRIGVGVCPLQPRIPALAGALAAAPMGFRSFGRSEPLVLDPHLRVVTGPGGAVELSDLQFALLASMSRRPGMTCPTSVLLREVWGEGVSSGAAARRRLEVLASRLRARLVSIEVNVATVPKRGYRLELDHPSVSAKAPPVG
ncbi:MAG TPA: uroporphyrinogen-III synthase [Acidimicrobiia bacterium]|nr:uroporphyrinogen-III synthase [Acidimicrobiia bacterium]